MSRLHIGDLVIRDDSICVVTGHYVLAHTQQKWDGVNVQCLAVIRCLPRHTAVLYFGMPTFRRTGDLEISVASHEEIMMRSGRHRCVFQMGDLIVTASPSLLSHLNPVRSRRVSVSGFPPFGAAKFTWVRGSFPAKGS